MASGVFGLHCDEVDTTATHRWSGIMAAAVLVLTFGGVAAGVTLEAQGNGPALHPADLVLTAAFLSLPAVGALLVWRRPENGVGWLLAATGALGGVYVTAHGWAVYALRIRAGGAPGGTFAAWLVTWLLVPTIGVLPYLAATFPHGHIERRALRRFGWVALVALVAQAFAQALAPDTLDGVDARFAPIPNPLGVDALEGPGMLVTNVSVLLVLAFTFAALVDAAVRYRGASGDERRQLRGVVVFPGLVPATIAASFLVPGMAGAVLLIGGQVVALLGLSAAIAVSVLRYRLYDLGEYVRRTAAYAALSAAVVISVLVLASLAGLLVPAGGTASAAVAAAAVALALGPLRARLQAGVDRLLFGRRHEPYSVLAEVGARLEASLSPASALTGVVETLVASLRVPYAAIEVDGEGAVPRVSHGEPGGPATRFPLVHQHQRIGTLTVGNRSPDEVFTERERRLLGDLARQVAVAAHAATVTGHLRQARLELVRGREEERRRLRRDIHDGLGPTLAGTLLQLDTLLVLIEDDSPEVRALAARIKENLRLMVNDVRRVSHNLRPPALDELGLVDALREQVHSLTTGAGFDVELDLPVAHQPLGAAAEVAVYRIASEALTNVVRHAGARHCGLRLSVDGGVDLEVIDDGIGVPDGSTPGVGLVSMRQRAAELGGSCTIETIEPAGTRVHARLPITP
jgi:two-component system NarL family sensor kinase